MLQKKDGGTFMNLTRLWTIVFATNVIGAIVFALVLAKLDLVGPDVNHSLKELATESTAASFILVILRGIFAGWLIAMMVWLMPFAETARVWVIIIITYVVGLGGLSHVIAGTVDAAYLTMIHERTWNEFLVGFTLPALIGNVIGGVTLVAALAHAQLVSGEN
jgi:formate/nitrite transporter FocA (FNT family)